MRPVPSLCQGVFPCTTILPRAAIVVPLLLLACTVQFCLFFRLPKEKTVQYEDDSSNESPSCEGRLLPPAWIEDDYCDCLDGIDEKRTSACSDGIRQQRFLCLEGGVQIFSSRVGDGICDCCEGSDEAPGHCVRGPCGEHSRLRAKIGRLGVEH
ncbi:unnamed protein product [Phaeothamnion confervicola]